VDDRSRNANSIPVLGTEPASENRIRSCCGSSSGIRFYCKPVTLVRCREIGGEIRFSGRVVGKWLCEMTSAFIINELRGARALRLFCGRSAFPPPITKDNPVSLGSFSGVMGFLFSIVFKGFTLRHPWLRGLRPTLLAPSRRILRLGLRPFHIFPKHLSTPSILPIFQPFFLCLAPDSLFSPDQVRSSSGKLHP
jgi:hypothetical protein